MGARAEANDTGQERVNERTYRRVLIPLALNALGFAFLETAVIPALPLIQKQLHATNPTSSALLESAYLAVAAVMSPLLGRWGDKKGKKGPLLVALGIYCSARSWPGSRAACGR